MPTIQNVQAYYNRYDSNRHYKKIRFISGRGSQSAEVNELQEILLENNKEIFNTLFKNGSIVSGGNITRNNNTLLIEAGIIYYDGFTIQVPSKTIQLVSGQDDSIGVLISENIITYQQDNSLLNPATGTILFKTIGADRLQIVGEWEVSSNASNLPTNKKFFPRYTIVDGNLNEIEVVAKTEIQNTQYLLERYDYDSNGNYVVSGLNTYFDSSLPLENKHLLTIKHGVCHVSGKEYTFNFNNKIKVNYPLVTKLVTGEPSEYKTTNQTYSFRNTPVASVSEILAIKQATNISIIHGNYSGASDVMPNTPVASVLEVKQGAITYIKNVDYRIVGDSIDWSLSGAEPAPGSTYTVTFTYVSTNINYTLSSDLTYLTIPSSNNILDGSSLFITYSFYLPRKDRLIVNTSGDLEILEGFPVPLNPVVPTIKDGLSLAIISLNYGKIPDITLDTYQAFKMSDILNLKNRIDNIEFNISQMALAEDVRSTDPTSNKVNMFVDAMYDDDLRDSGQTQNAVIVNQILIPFVDFTSTNVYQGKEIILDYTNSYAINQDSFTKSRQINEFTWESAPPANLTISPSTYRWVANEVIKDIWEPTQNRMWKRWSSPDRVIINRDTAVDTTTSEDFIQIDAEIPPIAINLKGGKWNFNEIIEIYFDSKKVLEITADNAGFINYNFAIPVGSRSGNLPIKLVGKVSGVSADAVFSAQPLSRVITKRHQTYYVWNDPIAQTFTLTNDTFIKSVELFFESNSTNFVDVFITKTLVGFPDRTKAVARKRLYPQEIFINTWQEFIFDQPVALNANEEYAIIVECTDPNAKVKVAELGKFADNTGKWLTGQALDSGVLLNSANGSTWSPIQKEDLAFKLKSCVFNSSKEISLGIVNVSNCTDIILLTGIDIPSGASIKFQAILLDRANETYDISTYSPVNVLVYSGDIQIKAYLNTTFNNVSPAIEGDILLSIGTVSLSSNYITRAFNINSSSTKLQSILEINEPAGSSVIVQYKNGSNWITMTRNTSKSENIGNNWTRCVFESTISNLSSTNIQIILNSSDSLNRPFAKNLRSFTTIA